MRRAWILLSVVLGGGCLSEPPPVALDLPSDPDEPIPSPRFASEREAREQKEARNAETQRDVKASEARRHCPGSARAQLDVPLHGGPTFDRIAAQMKHDVSAIQLVEPPVPIAGAHYYEVHTGSGYCTLGWSQTDCYVTDEAVHCGDGRNPAALASFLEHHGLGRHPDALDAASWVRLLAVFGNGTPQSSLPELRDCATPSPAYPPPKDQIELSAREASIAVPSRRSPWDESEAYGSIEVEIHDGRIEVTFREPDTPWSDPTIYEAVAGDVR